MDYKKTFNYEALKKMFVDANPERAQQYGPPPDEVIEGFIVKNIDNPDLWKHVNDPQSGVRGMYERTGDIIDDYIYKHGSKKLRERLSSRGVAERYDRMKTEKSLIKKLLRGEQFKGLLFSAGTPGEIGPAERAAQEVVALGLAEDNEDLKNLINYRLSLKAILSPSRAGEAGSFAHMTNIPGMLYDITGLGRKIRDGKIKAEGGLPNVLEGYSQSTLGGSVGNVQIKDIVPLSRLTPSIGNKEIIPELQPTTVEYSAIIANELAKTDPFMRNILKEPIQPGRKTFVDDAVSALSYIAAVSPEFALSGKISNPILNKIGGHLTKYPLAKQAIGKIMQQATKNTRWAGALRHLISVSRASVEGASQWATQAVITGRPENAKDNAISGALMVGGGRLFGGGRIVGNKVTGKLKFFLGAAVGDVVPSTINRYIKTGEVDLQDIGVDLLTSPFLALRALPSIERSQKSYYEDLNAHIKRTTGHDVLATSENKAEAYKILGDIGNIQERYIAMAKWSDILGLTAEVEAAESAPLPVLTPAKLPDKKGPDLPIDRQVNDYIPLIDTDKITDIQRSSVSKVRDFVDFLSASSEYTPEQKHELEDWLRDNSISAHSSVDFIHKAKSHLGINYPVIFNEFVRDKDTAALAQIYHVYKDRAKYGEPGQFSHKTIVYDRERGTRIHDTTKERNRRFTDIEFTSGMSRLFGPDIAIVDGYYDSYRNKQVNIADADIRDLKKIQGQLADNGWYMLPFRSDAGIDFLSKPHAKLNDPEAVAAASKILAENDVSGLFPIEGIDPANFKPNKFALNEYFYLQDALGKNFIQHIKDSGQLGNIIELTKRFQILSAKGMQSESASYTDIKDVRIEDSQAFFKAVVVPDDPTVEKTDGRALVRPDVFDHMLKELGIEPTIDGKLISHVKAFDYFKNEEQGAFLSKMKVERAVGAELDLMNKLGVHRLYYDSAAKYRGGRKIGEVFEITPESTRTLMAEEYDYVDDVGNPRPTYTNLFRQNIYYIEHPVVENIIKRSTQRLNEEVAQAMTSPEAFGEWFKNRVLKRANEVDPEDELEGTPEVQMQTDGVADKVFQSMDFSKVGILNPVAKEYALQAISNYIRQSVISPEVRGHNFYFSGMPEWADKMIKADNEIVLGDHARSVYIKDLMEHNTLSVTADGKPISNKAFTTLGELYDKYPNARVKVVAERPPVEDAGGVRSEIIVGIGPEGTGSGYYARKREMNFHGGADNDWDHVSILFENGDQWENALIGKYNNENYIREANDAAEAKIKAGNKDPKMQGIKSIFDQEAVLEAGKNILNAKSAIGRLMSMDRTIRTLAARGFKVGVTDKPIAPQQDKPIFNRSLWRGLSYYPEINQDGSITIFSGYDNLWKGRGTSYSDREDIALNYARRYSSKPVVIEVNRDYIEKMYPYKAGNKKDVMHLVPGEANELRTIGSNSYNIPKDHYRIIYYGISPENAKNLDYKILTNDELLALRSQYDREYELSEYSSSGDAASTIDMDLTNVEPYVTAEIDKRYKSGQINDKILDEFSWSDAYHGLPSKKEIEFVNEQSSNALNKLYSNLKKPTVPQQGPTAGISFKTGAEYDSRMKYWKKAVVDAKHGGLKPWPEIRRQIINEIVDGIPLPGTDAADMILGRKNRKTREWEIEPNKEFSETAGLFSYVFGKNWQDNRSWTPQEREAGINKYFSTRKPVTQLERAISNIKYPDISLLRDVVGDNVTKLLFTEGIRGSGGNTYVRLLQKNQLTSMDTIEKTKIDSNLARDIHKVYTSGYDSIDKAVRARVIGKMMTIADALGEPFTMGDYSQGAARKLVDILGKNPNATKLMLKDMYIKAGDFLNNDINEITSHRMEKIIRKGLTEDQIKEIIAPRNNAVEIAKQLRTERDPEKRKEFNEAIEAEMQKLADLMEANKDNRNYQDYAGLQLIGTLYQPNFNRVDGRNKLGWSRWIGADFLKWYGREVNKVFDEVRIGSKVNTPPKKTQEPAETPTKKVIPHPQLVQKQMERTFSMLGKDAASDAEVRLAIKSIAKLKNNPFRRWDDGMEFARIILGNTRPIDRLYDFDKYPLDKREVKLLINEARRFNRGIDFLKEGRTDPIVNWMYRTSTPETISKLAPWTAKWYGDMFDTSRNMEGSLNQYTTLTNKSIRKIYERVGNLELAGKVLQDIIEGYKPIEQTMRENKDLTPETYQEILNSAPGIKRILDGLWKHLEAGHEAFVENVKHDLRKSGLSEEKIAAYTDNMKITRIKNFFPRFSLDIERFQEEHVSSLSDMISLGEVTPAEVRRHYESMHTKHRKLRKNEKIEYDIEKVLNTYIKEVIPWSMRQQYTKHTNNMMDRFIQEMANTPEEMMPAMEDFHKYFVSLSNFTLGRVSKYGNAKVVRGKPDYDITNNIIKGVTPTQGEEGNLFMEWTDAEGKKRVVDLRTENMDEVDRGMSNYNHLYIKEQEAIHDRLKTKPQTRLALANSDYRIFRGVPQYEGEKLVNVKPVNADISSLFMEYTTPTGETRYKNLYTDNLYEAKRKTTKMSLDRWGNFSGNMNNALLSHSFIKNIGFNISSAIRNRAQAGLAWLFSEHDAIKTLAEDRRHTYWMVDGRRKWYTEVLNEAINDANLGFGQAAAESGRELENISMQDKLYDEIADKMFDTWFGKKGNQVVKFSRDVREWMNKAAEISSTWKITRHGKEIGTPGRQIIGFSQTENWNRRKAFEMGFHPVFKYYLDRFLTVPKPGSDLPRMSEKDAIAEASRIATEAGVKLVALTQFDYHSYNTPEIMRMTGAKGLALKNILQFKKFTTMYYKMIKETMLNSRDEFRDNRGIQRVYNKEAGKLASLMATHAGMYILSKHIGYNLYNYVQDDYGAFIISFWRWLIGSPDTDYFTKKETPLPYAIGPNFGDAVSLALAATGISDADFNYWLKYHAAPRGMRKNIDFAINVYKHPKKMFSHIGRLFGLVREWED